jgi:hypothetical protein
LKGAVRKAQQLPPISGGKVSGGSSVLGSSKNTGKVNSEDYLGMSSSTSLGNSAFDLKSKGSGFVDTIYGGATGQGTSAVSGTSSESIKGNNIPAIEGSNFPALVGSFGESTSGGSSVASAAGAFDGQFTPSGVSGETGGFGSGIGSLDVTGSGTVSELSMYLPPSSGVTSGGGTAKTSAGGSAKGFNGLTSAGGRGSGSAQGNATGAIDGPFQVYGVNAGSASTGTFTGIGSGSSGNRSNQPYTGGIVNGKGSGAGTAAVNGLVEFAVRTPFGPTKTGGDAAFKSNGDGAGFVDSTNGSALGSASAAVSGAAAGNTGGVPVEYVDFTNNINVFDATFGQLSISGNSAANGEGAFAGGFSAPQASGPTGGSGSGTGSLNVAGAGSGSTAIDYTNDPNGYVVPFLFGTAVGSGKAQTTAGGSASGFNDLGSAGGLGSGASQGSANGAINSSAPGGDPASSGAGNVTGTFNNAGSGSFGLPSSSFAFP